MNFKYGYYEIAPIVFFSDIDSPRVIRQLVAPIWGLFH